MCKTANIFNEDLNWTMNLPERQKDDLSMKGFVATVDLTINFSRPCKRITRDYVMYNSDANIFAREC